MDGPLRNMTYATLVPGKTRKCPICGQTLSNAEMGVNAHLRRHIRSGELNKRDEQDMRMRILKRTFDAPRVIQE